ncbi:MAG: ABC transporter substrate-binding protein [Kosmotoga sp.]|nr:ABC transporter substrate-binding protein [Kosmotoga sp.]
MFEPDGESVTYAIVEGPGEINGDYYDCSNITEPGQYSVSIEASDGISSSTISFNISAYKLFGKWTGYYYEGDSVEIEVTFTESDFQITYIAENYTITGTYTVDTSIYPANIDLFIDEPVYGILKFEDDTLYISINDPRPSDFSQNNILLVLESTEQILTELTIGGPETLDPHYCYETAGGAVILNVYDNLIKYKGDSVTVFEPMISTEVPTVENGLIKDGGTKYVFPIREGIKFHSGNVLTPYDVEYSFERGILFDPSGGPMWMIIEALSGGDYASLEGWFEAYSGMAYSDAVDEDRNPTSEEAKAKLIAFYNEVIDPLVEVDGNNVVFTLHGPFAPFMWIISHYAGWSAVIDSQWAKDNGAWDGNADGWWKWHDLQPEETPLHSVDAGCGPFKVVEWDRAQQKVILERFDEYWRGPAKLKTVIIWGIDEYSTRKAMLEAGDADIVYVPTQYKEQVVNMPGVRIIDGYPTSAITSFHFNWKVKEGSEYIGSGKLDGNGVPPEFFSDLHVRKAFYYCYDGQTFIEEVLNGYGKLVPTDLPEGYLGYDETLPIPELNLTAAASEFQQAFSGELWEKGFTLTLLYNTGNETRQAAAEMFKSNIESLNQKFHIDVQGVQWSEYYNAQIDGHMPAFILGWLADYPDPHNFLATFYASYGIYASRQGTAFVEFAKDNIDGLINTAIKETDPAKRDELYKEVQRIAIDNTLGVSLYMPLGFHVERDWVQGWYPHPMRSGTNYYELSKSQ